MSTFLDRLDVEQVEDTGEEGRGTWRVLKRFRYQSTVAGRLFVVPVGFVTDFASVPRVPLVFDWLGDRGNLAATLHDWLYTVKPVSRKMADRVLLEALQVQGVGKLASLAIYLGVRVGGGSHYK